MLAVLPKELNFRLLRPENFSTYLANSKHFIQQWIYVLPLCHEGCRDSRPSNRISHFCTWLLELFEWLLLLTSLTKALLSPESPFCWTANCRKTRSASTISKRLMPLWFWEHLKALNCFRSLFIRQWDVPDHKLDCSSKVSVGLGKTFHFIIGDLSVAYGVNVDFYIHSTKCCATSKGFWILSESTVHFNYCIRFLWIGYRFSFIKIGVPYNSWIYDAFQLLSNCWMILMASPYLSGCGELRPHPQPCAQQGGSQNWWKSPHHPRRPGYWLVSFLCHLPFHPRSNGKCTLPSFTLSPWHTLLYV